MQDFLICGGEFPAMIPIRSVGRWTWKVLRVGDRGSLLRGRWCINSIANVIDGFDSSIDVNNTYYYYAVGPRYDFGNGRYLEILIGEGFGSQANLDSTLASLADQFAPEARSYEWGGGQPKRVQMTYVDVVVKGTFSCTLYKYTTFEQKKITNGSFVALAAVF